MTYPARTEAGGPSTLVARDRNHARFGRWARSAGIVTLAFGAAFALDMATGQRYSQVLGSIAIVVSLLGIWPRARDLVVPIGAYSGLWVGFNALRAFGDEVPWRDRWLDVVPRLEARLFGGVLPSISLQRQLFDPVRIDWFDQFWTSVYLSFFVVPHVVAVVLLVRNRDRFWRYVAAAAVLFLIGAVAFAALPTNPPWLANPVNGGGTALRVINLVLADAGLRADIPADGGSLAQHHNFELNPVATMPSIHLGVTALLVPLAASRAWRLLAIAYATAMAFSLIYLGEHYVLDAVAGALTAATAWLAARCLLFAPRGTPGRRAVPEKRPTLPWSR